MNENWVTQHTAKENWNQYNIGLANRTKTLTHVSPSATTTHGACRYGYISHSMSENNTYGGNDCSSHQT